MLLEDVFSSQRVARFCPIAAETRRGRSALPKKGGPKDLLPISGERVSSSDLKGAVTTPLKCYVLTILTLRTRNS